MFVAPLLDGGRWPVNGTETTILKAVRRVFTFPEELPDVGGLVAGILVESEKIDVSVILLSR